MLVQSSTAPVSIAAARCRDRRIGWHPLTTALRRVERELALRNIRDSSEDEMVFEFLAAELYSGLFGRVLKDCLKIVGADRSLLYTRDFDNPAANDLRRSVLSCYRGYRRNMYLFTGFPKTAEWKLVEVSIEELGGFYYAASPGVQEWVDISKGSRLVRDGANHLDERPADDHNRVQIAVIEERIRNGQDHARLIAMAKNEDGPYILAEGHKRATAYLRISEPDETVAVIIGYAPDLDSWEYRLRK